MTLLAVDNLTDTVRPAKDIVDADYVFTQKNKIKDPWRVIDILVNMWAERSPERFKAFKLHLDDTRSGLRDRKFATTPDKHMERRLVVIFPQDLYLMIRSVYKAWELPFSRDFNYEFAKRYPFFKIPEKT